MKKFGQFNPGGVHPVQEFEGDYMDQQGEYVKIFARSANQSVKDEQIAAIRLDKDQSVKPMN